MGFMLSKVFNSLFGNKEVRILILGLDNAGKTTILYRLQADEPIETIPTIGFNVETLQYKNIKFQVWDLGGQTSIRPYWRCYFEYRRHNIRCGQCGHMLCNSKIRAMAMPQEEELKDAILLILPTNRRCKAVKVLRIVPALGLTSIKDSNGPYRNVCS